MNDLIRQVQLSQLDVALEVKKICKKNNISFFITGGTLRGAYLCKGFLPNDGDIDIGMLRPDYEKFLCACSFDLPDEYYLQNYHTEKNIGFLYSKIRIKNTEYTETFSKDVDIAKGIFIDIYPFDVMPNSYFLRLKQKYLHKYYKGLLMVRFGYQTKYDYIPIIGILKLINKFLSAEEIYRKSEKNLIMYNNKDYRIFFSFEGGHSYNERISKNDATNLTKIEFEKYFFPAPLGLVAFLKRMYGNDYKNIPHKCNHNILKISCGDYKFRNLRM